MLAIVLQLALPDAPPPESVAGTPRIAVPPSPVIVANDHVVIEAPIFTPDRAPDPADRSGPATSGDLVLLALAQAHGTSVALIKGGDGTVHRVLQGAEVDGWRFTSVAGGRAVLERNGLAKTLAVVPGQAVPVNATVPAETKDATQDEDNADQ
jgi:hypothetical protein